MLPVPSYTPHIMACWEPDWT